MLSAKLLSAAFSALISIGGIGNVRISKRGQGIGPSMVCSNNGAAINNTFCTLKYLFYIFFI